ncbi:MAG: ADOP family duplicated permease [Acidobacteriota bacterium]
MGLDLRIALRALRKEPIVSAAVVLILALGIGTHTAAFSVINAALLRPIATLEAEQMVVVESESQKTGGTYGLSVADSDDYLERAKTLQSIGAFESRRDNLRLDDGTVLSIPSAVVTSGVLPATGVRPHLGRLFDRADDRQGADSFKVILSHALWRSRFDSDAEIMGRRIRTSLGTYTVVGVLPRGYGFPDSTQIWFPYQNWIDTQDTSDTRSDQRVSRWSEGIARLARGVTLDQARQEVLAIGEALAETYPEANELWRPRLTPYREAETATLRPHLRSLWVLTWLFLGLAVVTLASLQTARSVSRSAHFGLQRALGAQPRRLARQLLLETLILAAAGGVLSLLLALGFLQLLPLLVQDGFPEWIDGRLDGAEVSVSALSVLLVSALAALGPLSVALKPDLRSLLGQRLGDRGAGAARVRKGLVVAQVALASLLIVGAFLLAASFRNLTLQDPGFDPEKVLVVELSPQFEGDYYEQTASLANFYERVQQEIGELPGVDGVGGATNLPYLDTNRRPVTVLARGGSTEEEQEHQTPIMTIDMSPGYFDGLGIDLLEGRDLAWTDDREKGMVIVLSRRAAELLFPGQSALDREVRISGDSWARVVGVVDDVRYDPRESSFGAELYYPIAQYKAFRLRVAVRTQGDPESMIRSVRERLAKVAPETGVIEIRTLESIMNGALWQARLLGAMGPLFALISLALAALGLYGLLRGELGMRRREFGLRAALGAPVKSLGGLVVGYGLRLVLLGLVVGLLAAFGLGPALAASLFGVEARDPEAYLTTAGVLVLAGALACLGPALGAIRVDPKTALQDD